MNASTAYIKKRIPLTLLMAAILFMLLGVSRAGWNEVSPLIEHSLSMVGWMLIACAVSGRLWCGSHISGRKQGCLVTVGPYSISRNPLYFFSFLGGLGVMLTTETVILPLLFSLAFYIYYAKVISREERNLLSIYETAYQEYRFRVPRFFPNFRLLDEPVAYTVSTYHFRRNLIDVCWFIVAGAGMEFIEGMHDAGILPTLLTIY